MFNLRFKSAVLVFLIRKIVVILFLIGFSHQAFAGNAYNVQPLPEHPEASGAYDILEYNDLLVHIQNAREGQKFYGTVAAVDYDSGTDTITVKTTRKSTLPHGDTVHHLYRLTGPLGDITVTWDVNGRVYQSKFFHRNEDNSFSYDDNDLDLNSRIWVDIDKNGNIIKTH